MCTVYQVACQMLCVQGLDGVGWGWGGGVGGEAESAQVATQIVQIQKNDVQMRINKRESSHVEHVWMAYTLGW